MEEIKKEVEEEKEKINNDKNKTPKKSTKKIKKKKKGKKKKPEKEYKNLKELLDDINKEKEEKLLKEKKLKEKEDKKKEEEKEKDEIQIKENINITNSISGTTTGTLSLDDFMPNYLLINNNDNSENDFNEEDFFKKRKMSSPIFDYYNGYDKFLSQEKEGSIDLKNSVNFVEKNKFISSCELNLSKLNINQKENDVKDKNVNNINNKFNENNNNNNNNIKYINNIYPNEEINYMNYYFDYYIDPQYVGNNDIHNIINNINNNIEAYYPCDFPYNNKKPKKYFEKMKRSTQKVNNIRIGDWTCSYCYNLNFSFRKSCNRCNAPKQVL